MQKTGLKLDIFHLFWDPFQNLMKNEIFEHLWESMREVWDVRCHVVKGQSKNQISSEKRSKIHEKCPIGVRGFLHVIRKLIPQQDPNVPITLNPFVNSCIHAEV